MFRTILNNLNKLIAAGIILAFIAPALPALAANNAVVDTTASQAATSGQAVEANNGITPALATVPATSLPVDSSVIAPTSPVVPYTSANSSVLPVVPATPYTPLPPITTPACTPDPVVASNTTVNPTTLIPIPPLLPVTPPVVPAVTPPLTPLVVPDPTPPSTITPSTNATINNCINSAATSGNAKVNNNSKAGNATTGDAAAAATLLNLVQSVTNLGAGGLATFSQDIGNTNGNVPIDPSALTIWSAQSAACGCNALLQALLSANINNELNLNATSGNATVANNTTAGNATSGAANALANVVNIINSVTNASQAFLGVININGNLNGNILLPVGWYDSLLSSSPPPSSCTVGCGSPGNSNSDMTILNNIKLTATTGDATVTNNGTAGNANSGNAATNLNVINLINRQIVGGNVLLVFVNVLGHWVGYIMNAPAGATTATLGGNISGDSSTSPCGCQAGISNLLANITNNINLTATSGDATVTNNGTAGNAKSGNATASLNLVNIINSQFSLSGWLGILFINVFGTWNGSLVSATPPVDPVVIPVVIVPIVTPTTSFITKYTQPTQNSDPSSDTTTTQPKVLGAGFINDGGDPPSSDTVTNKFVEAIAAGGLFCCVLLGALDRRNSKKTHINSFDSIAI